jgi:hypothetical protein
MSTFSEKKAHVRAASKRPHRDHHCHARGCPKKTPPAYFMCPAHWRMVPRDLQAQVWDLYNAGQEDGQANVSREYLEVTDKAIAVVATKEAERAASDGQLFDRRPRR